MAALIESNDLIPDNSQILEEYEATEEEKKRFLIGHKGNLKSATKALAAHMEWKKKLPLPLTEERMKYGAGQMPGTDKLPGWMGMLTNPKTGEYIRSKVSNTRIVWAYGAMCDLDLETDDYVSATADFLHANLPRDSDEKITVLVDVRPADGWKAPAPLKFVPLVKAINAQLSINFPERIQEIVVFPMPWWAVAIFNMVKLFMNPKTAAKMSMLSGSADKASPDPEGVRDYIDEGVGTVEAMQCYPHEFKGAATNAEGVEEK